MFQTLVAAMIIILAALISIGVYSIVKDGHNVIAYIMLGICGICILFIFGMIVCVVSCYPAPSPDVILVAPATASAHAETFRDSNPIHSPLPAPRISAPAAATAIAPYAETFNGSNPMHPMHPMHP
jgi:hypothetical protein